MGPRDESFVDKVAFNQQIRLQGERGSEKKKPKFFFIGYQIAVATFAGVLG